MSHTTHILSRLANAGTVAECQAIARDAKWRALPHPPLDVPNARWAMQYNLKATCLRAERARARKPGGTALERRLASGRTLVEQHALVEFRRLCRAFQTSEHGSSCTIHVTEMGPTTVVVHTTWVKPSSIGLPPRLGLVPTTHLVAFVNIAQWTREVYARGLHDKWQEGRIFTTVQPDPQATREQGTELFRAQWVWPRPSSFELCTGSGWLQHFERRGTWHMWDRLPTPQHRVRVGFTLNGMVALEDSVPVSLTERLNAVGLKV